ncbi:protein late bloomer isoform X3 [Drosophila eugracilis]|uniref:protein late bloomer isoform X3 n=2 Tax=Drosophila eugracilis TaxID=29029 RepID=UPI0007E813B0|nr:protein late bloomer isoform X3 [Drosophila eugracilis]
MYCTTRLLRYVLCVISGICALGGCLLIWYGAWLLDSLSEQQRVMGLDNGEDLAAYLCILLGFVVVVASIFGSVAVAKDSRSLLICFVMVSISYAASRESLPDSLRQGFDDLWDMGHEGNSTLHSYEEWLHCCGRNSAEDYLHVEKMPPASCCLDRDCTQLMNLFMSGCEVKFKEYVSGKTANFHTLSWFLILFENLVLITVCRLGDHLLPGGQHSQSSRPHTIL